MTGRGSSEKAGETGKEAALRAALADAVDRACSAFLEKQRRLPRYSAALERVLADPAVFASDLRARTAPDTPAGWTVTLTAELAPARFERAWKQSYIRIAAPRLMVVVSEVRDGEKQDGGTVAAGLAGYLLKRGFRLVDKSQFSQVKEARLKEAALSDDLASAASIAREVGADLLVAGEVRARRGRSESVAGINFQFYTAEAVVKVVQADSAILVTTARARARAGSRDPGIAQAKALEQCTRQVAAKVWRGCLENWDALFPGRTLCELRVSGLSARDALGLEKQLKKVAGVSTVTLREMREGTARFTLLTSLPPKKLFATLVADEDLNRLIEVTGLANKVIRARWREDAF